MAKEVESQRKGKQTKKFTNEAIQGWRHPKQGQELYWDSARQNVTLLIGKRTKTFRYHFRLNDHWISTKLGQFSKTFGVKEAYDKASEIDVKVAQGSYIRIRKRRGTRIEIQSHPAGPVDLTYEQVVKQFIELSAKLTQRKWKESERVLMNDFKDWLPRAFKSITKAEARTTIERFIADKKVGKAANARAWIRRLWRWAADRDMIEVPIMDRLGVTIPKRVRDRVYSNAEIKAIWKAAEQFDSPDKVAYFKLLILLGPRKSALAAARWSDIQKDEWITPFEHTKSRLNTKPRVYRTPLPRLAKQILATLPRTDGRIFPTMRLHPTQPETRALCRFGAPADFMFHQLRHTLATWLENEGASEYERGLVLNHAGTGVTAGYSHGHSTKLKLELLEKWADHVASLI